MKRPCRRLALRLLSLQIGTDSVLHRQHFPGFQRDGNNFIAIKKIACNARKIYRKATLHNFFVACGKQQLTAGSGYFAGAKKLRRSGHAGSTVLPSPGLVRLAVDGFHAIQMANKAAELVRHEEAGDEPVEDGHDMAGQGVALGHSCARGCAAPAHFVVRRFLMVGKLMYLPVCPLQKITPEP